eukprot:685681-Ditylum_brightwellii.AAC.1
MADAETSALKVENSQEFNLCISATKKDNTYKFKTCTFLNGLPEDILEWEEKVQKIVKCNLVDTVEGKFELVEAILEGDALTQWLEFKWVEIVRTSKNPDDLNTALSGMCNPTFAICLQDLKHHFPKNASHLQKVYLCNHIKKLNKLSIKITTTRLRDANIELAKFLCTKWSNMIYAMLSANLEETPAT